MKNTSRRDFLKNSALLSTLFGVGGTGLSAQNREASENRPATARNVVMLVADGMNVGALSAAHQYLQLSQGKLAHWLELYRQRPVVRCLAETHSATSIVTDSAAAASAWGGGQRVINGALNISPEGREVETLAVKLKAVGKRVGLVTTATFTHATPAGFAVNISARGNENGVAQQYLERKIDLLLGGGRNFLPDELLAKYKAAGYEHASTANELAALPATSAAPLIGVFKGGYLPYEIDRVNDPELAARIPSLARMAKAALQRLSGSSPKGFFLMIEGARVDHAGHANDAAASIHDQIAFDEAIAVAVQFADKNPDTLVIITTDHGCGGIQMNGVGDTDFAKAKTTYGNSTPSFRKIETFKTSKESLSAKVKGLSGPKLADQIEEATGLKLSGETLQNAQNLKNYSELVGDLTGITWTGAVHTSELVEFCAFGPGASRFPGFIRNFEVHNHLLAALGVG